MRREPRKRCDHCQQFSRERSMDLVTLPESVLKYDYWGTAVCVKCGTSYSDDYWLAWLRRKGWDRPMFIHQYSADDVDTAEMSK